MPNRTTSPNTQHTQPKSPPPLQSPPLVTQAEHLPTHLLLTTSTTSKQVQHRFAWRLSEFWTQSITARSRRRRPCDSTNTTTTNNMHTLPTTVDTHLNAPASLRFSKARSAISMLRSSVTSSSLSSSAAAATTAAYVALLVLSTTCTLCAASPCQSHSWWDSVKDRCIPCTECQGQLIVLRPCQLHRDTICGSIYDLEIDWMVLAKTEPNWKERRKSSDNNDLNLLTNEELQQLQLQQQQQQHEDTIPLDWQTAALFLAVLACLLFFIVAACILIQHMRQWRRMERRLDQDVEELSTKLMAKLAEVQSLEGGTFFIGNADALKGPATFQPQHVLLPEKHTKHHNERRILKTLQPGNVYIEENGSKG